MFPSGARNKTAHMKRSNKCHALKDSRSNMLLSQNTQKKRFASHNPCVYLHILAARPDYQRRGYGKALTAWGIDVARKKHMPVCVQAGPRGYILFSGLGFADLGPVLLPADKGGDELVLKALMLESSRAQRRCSLVDSLLRYISR
ncbi:Uncharacterized protein TPAR_04727 [Tolypocladium paradoxum]|uniref:N-acetyltransferase domain-containing protein n=1 Tax=Tolypocladium paradoxum TaxID=94208 RepID=A0A2S4KY19_9HYPO|nr:Uncharacterized protein TPAR_04727 [Tolypocladium paradoxum]